MPGLRICRSHPHINPKQIFSPRRGPSEPRADCVLFCTILQEGLARLLGVLEPTPWTQWLRFGGSTVTLGFRLCWGSVPLPTLFEGRRYLLPRSVCYPRPGEAVAGTVPTLPPRGRHSMTSQALLPALLPDHKQLGL